MELTGKTVEAGINYFEFRYREADFSSYPKGLMYSLDILGDWLYEKENTLCTGTAAYSF